MASDAVDTPSSLLSLNRESADFLLSYVASGEEGGLQSLLNLREVCSTTKGWVDTLQPLQGKRIFRRCQVAIKLSRLELQRFVETPPPSHATSLRLQIGYLHHSKLGLNKTTQWKSFVNFWSPKLESLDLDVLSFPLDVGVLQMLNSPSLLRLYCHSIKVERSNKSPVQFPAVLFRLEEVCVGFLHMESSLKLAFFNEMSTNANLKRFYFSVGQGMVCERRCVRILMEAKKMDADFQFSLRFAGFQQSSWFFSLARSVVASLSKIRIVGVDDSTLIALEEKDEEGLAQGYFPKVVWISSFSKGYVEINRFPSLKRLEEFPGREETLEAAEFPLELEELQIIRPFGVPTRLPPNLSHLDLVNFKSSVTKLLEMLRSVGGRCVGLRSLKVSWTAQRPTDEEEEILEPNNINRFANLKSLSFGGTFLRRDSPNTARLILVEGFKLDQLGVLNLELLKCKDKRGAPLLDSETLSLIVEGSVGNSVTFVEIDESSVKEDARGLVERLGEVAAENEKKRRETKGRCAPQVEFWFD